MQTPWQQYQQDLQLPGMAEDEAQAVAMQALQSVFDGLLQPEPVVKRKRHWFSIRRQPDTPYTFPSVRGLYLWGGVGRGKTYLVDTFYECVPNGRKLREHFHHFMLRVHRELDTLKGHSDPLLIVADRLAAEFTLICLDEFYVSDITDAMLLGTLLEALFARRVVLVATSNLAPQELYRNGLQRARFLPAIAQIEQHCQVLNIDGGLDHRLRALSQGDVFTQNLSLAPRFEQLAGAHGRETAGSWQVNGRDVPFLGRAGDLIWFDFAALCQSARSSLDYIELARSYHTVLLSGVPAMNSEQDDSARRFIALIDELYDRRVKLVAELCVPLEGLYLGQQLAFEFQRTHSRLVEMQSQQYLAQAHRPD